MYGGYSLRGIRDHFYDSLSVHLASKVLLDTQAQCDYFDARFKLPKRKTVRVFVSTDPTVFDPALVERKPHDSFIVEFHGTYIPLQGIPYIIDAAKLLEGKPVEFRLIGSGQTTAAIEKKVRELSSSNITFLPRCSYEELRTHLANADVCLGIFGDTAKAARVIPNKVFEALAMGKPIITMDSPAARELLTDGTNALFCTPADGVSIAQAIERLMNDGSKRESLSRGARALYVEKLQPKWLVSGLLQNLVTY